MAGANKIVSGLTLFVLISALVLAYFNPSLVQETTTKSKELISVLVSRLKIAYRDFYSSYFNNNEKASAGNSAKSQSTSSSKTKAPEAEAEIERRRENEKLYDATELSQYDGSAGSPGLYLAVMGKIFDVQEGSQHYKPGSSYGVFTGKDASKAFVTGDFTEDGLTDDILGLPGEQLLGIQEWSEFYEKDYVYVGKLIGRFYDKNGSPTEYFRKVEDALSEAKREKKNELEERQIFPSCNSEWSHDLGGRVWCTALSGGVERDWVGVPRQLFKPGQSHPSCVCVRNKGPPSTKLNLNDDNNKVASDRGDLDHPHLKEYEKCAEDSETCDLIKKA